MTSTESELKEKLFGNKLLWRHRSDNSKNNFSLDELEKGYIFQ